MNFNEMLTFWSLKGILKQVDPGAASGWKGKKKVKVRLDNQHSMFVKYNDNGPINATLYFDNGAKFRHVDRVGVSKPVRQERVIDVIESWIKDLA